MEELRAGVDLGSLIYLTVQDRLSTQYFFEEPGI